MKILEVASGKMFPVLVLPVELKDYHAITKKRYFFDWKSESSDSVVFKIFISGQNDILGLMALKEHSGEMRSEIKLICVSRENKGSGKKYDRIVGCLIAYACRQARLNYDETACVSLIPKTGIKDHYMRKYGMLNAGWQIYLEAKALDEMIVNYFL